MINFTVMPSNYVTPSVCQLNQHQQRELLENMAQAQSDYEDSLGWMDPTIWAGHQKLTVLNQLATEIREQADVYVLIGVGGSNNAARAVIEALKTDQIEIIYTGNTLSPHAINNVLKQIANKNVYVTCIAKNFETLEPGATFRLLRQFMEESYGTQASQRISVIGSRGSHLEQLCAEKGYRFLEFPPDVGGRYSAITNVGLLPMAVAGIDIEEVVRGAIACRDSIQHFALDHPAYQYAVYRNYLYQAGFKVEMLASFEPQLSYFNKWWLQLFAESEGKQSKGILPTYAQYSEDLHAVGQFVQDGSPILLETFITINEANDSLIFPENNIADGFDYLNGQDFWAINQAALKATLEAHAATTPVAMIQINKLDAYHFGELFYFFQYACFISGILLDVNPFDQPGVEAYKQGMFERLKHEK